MKNYKGLQFTLALICIIGTYQISSEHIYVKPSNYNSSMNCTGSCAYLNKLPKIISTPNVQLHLLAGDHILNGKFSVQDVLNFSVVGQKNRVVTISCVKGTGQISVTNSTNVNITNIKFIACGTMLLDLVNVYKYIYSKSLRVAVLFYRCMAIQIVNVQFQNSYGHSIIAIGMKGVSAITNTTFFHTLPLLSYPVKAKITFAGIIFDSTEFGKSSSSESGATLILEHCTFYNLDGINTDLKLLNSPYNIGTALTLIHSNRSSDGHLKVQILNSNFVNCTCYTGPLISLYYSPYKDMSFCLSNVTIYNNKILAVELHANTKRSSLIELGRNRFSLHNLFHNFSKPKIQVELTHCSILQNIATGNVIQQFESQESNMYFIIDDCVFSDNEVADTFMLVRNCLMMKNSKYIYNNACKASVYQYTGEKCAFLICYTDTVIFTGTNEFSFNSLDWNHFWIVNDHIILEENTLLNFSSNLVGKAMIKINKQGSVINKQESVIKDNRLVYFPLCPIQYMSYRGSLNEEFINKEALNFSFIFHNNLIVNNSTPTIILGKTFKDCEWLPNSAFTSLHPGVVAKRFVHFDYQIKNPTGFPYAGCLCFKDADIDCISDEIGLVYPGQTLEIGFVIMDVHNDKMQRKMNKRIYQGVLKANSTCKLESIVPILKFVHMIPGNCSYFNYTVTFNRQYRVIFDPQGYQECAFVHYFQDLDNTAILYNKYYLTFLTCPPGFQLANDKCTCHPDFKKITQFPTCNINDQSILKPSNVWIMYSNATGNSEIMYATNCPIGYCSSMSFYIQLQFINSTLQCNNNRKGLMCGECVNGFSATFGSSKCKRCSNIWLTVTIAILLVGLLLIVVLFAIKIDITNTNITGLILYANIISINSFNIFSQNARESLVSSLAMILISLLNLDLGFELCFYNGMTEYTKLWLQLIFPVYLIFLTSLVLLIRKHAKCVKRYTRYSGNTTMAIIVLVSSNKIIAACRNLLLYNHLSYFESDKAKYLWSVYPSIPLFAAKYWLYFLVCCISVTLLITFNITLAISKKFIQGKKFRFVSILDVYQDKLKKKHTYWPIAELLLRLITTVSLVLNKQLSLLLNTIAIVMFACCLGIASPFKDIKHNFMECTFVLNLLCVFVCAFYFGDNKTTHYYMLVSILIFLAVIQFVIQIIYHNNADRFQETYKSMNNCFRALQKRCIRSFRFHAYIPANN